MKALSYCYILASWMGMICIVCSECQCWNDNTARDLWDFGWNRFSVPLNVCRKKRLNWVILLLRPFNPRPRVTASFRILVMTPLSPPAEWLYWAYIHVGLILQPLMVNGDVSRWVRYSWAEVKPLNAYCKECGLIVHTEVKITPWLKL